MAWSNVDSISIPWGNVYGKPNRAGSSSDGGAANSVANSLTISLNGTSQGAYNGSAAKSVNITAASVGAAASSHNHSAANITSGTLPVSRGGTGATTAANALSNLGGVAKKGTVSSVSVGGSDSNSQYIQTEVTTTAGVHRCLYCKDTGFGLWNYNESKDQWTIPVTAKARGLEAYPVGALYMSFVSTSPATLFGGSWSQISNRFIYAGNGTSTGGSLRHKHWTTVGKAVGDGMYVYDFDQSGTMFGARLMTGHVHGGLMNYTSFDTYTTSSNQFSQVLIDSTSDPVLNVTDYSSNNNNKGESDLYPPYQMVYCWRRTA